MFKGDIDRPSSYEGPRDDVGIIKYLKKQVRTASGVAAAAASGIRLGTHACPPLCSVLARGCVPRMG